jgi:hypothetical protein
MVSCARRSIDGAPAAVGSVLDIYLLSVCLSVSLAAAALTSTELSLCLSHSLRLPRLSHTLCLAPNRAGELIEEPCQPMNRSWCRSTWALCSKSNVKEFFHIY